jgi:REP element-mobilizing transposase RayT
MPDRPLAYFITFHTYGTWLHGAEAGSVNDEHNQPGEPWIEPDASLHASSQRRMSQDAYLLDEPRRRVVRDAIVAECRFRGWNLHALHVRSNHVHLVATASHEPEFVMLSCKAQASKSLNRAGFDHSDRKRWTAHGSTRYLWSEESVAEKTEYTLHGQGEPMATYPDLSDESEPKK